MTLQLLSSISTGLTIAMALFLSAAGLTVLFGVLRILNFAHGTFIAIGAYVASYALGKGGVGFFGSGIGVFVTASVAAGLVVALIGMVVDRVVFSRLRHVDESSALIATFALMLLMHGVMTLIWGADIVSVDPPIGLDSAVIFGRLVIPEYSLFLILAGVLVFVALELMMGRIWFGKIIKSVATDPVIMAIMGFDIRKLVGIAIALSFFLAGFAGGLLAPNQALKPHLGESLILQAFAVVIIGGLGSVPGAFMASILLGLAESFGSRYMPSLALYIGMVLILLVRPEGLVATGSIRPHHRRSWLQRRATMRRVQKSRVPITLLPRQADTAEESQMFWQRPAARIVALVLIAAILLSLLPWWASPGTVYIASYVMIQAVFALSWNLLFGFAGLAVFGHAAFFAIGAYLVAVVMKAGLPIPFPLLLLASGLLGALVAAPVGAITVRRAGGLQLAILTLALSEAFRVLVSYSELLGRDEGLSAVPRPTLDLLFVSIPLTSGGSYFVFLLACCGLLTGCLWWLAHGEFGRVLRSLHQDPERAAFIGIDIDRYRLVAFVLASAIAAVVGGLAAPLTQIVSPETASVANSTAPMLNALLGGATNFWGPVIGSVAFSGIQYATRTLAGLSELVTGTALLAVVLITPDGIVGLLSRTYRLARSWIGSKEPRSTGATS